MGMRDGTTDRGRVRQIVRKSFVCLFACLVGVVGVPVRKLMPLLLYVKVIDTSC